MSLKIRILNRESQKESSDWGDAIKNTEDEILKPYKGDDK